MKFSLLGRFLLDQTDDRVTWIRIFENEKKMLAGHGVYRDDVLILLAPSEAHDIRDVRGVKEELGIDELPVWDKTRYLIHMGSERQNYSVDEAIYCDSGQTVAGDELTALVERIQKVF
jgi:hypothetical protein